MNKHRGFSLIEMMIALALGLLIVGAIMAVLVSSSGIYRSAESRGKIQENSRFSLGVLQEDVRNAGYLGCFNMNLMGARFKSLVKDPVFKDDYKAGVSGYEASGSSWSPALDANIGQTGFKPVSGNDVLVLRVPVGKTLPIAGVVTTDAEPLPVADIDGLKVGGLAAVSDCSIARLFVVTQDPADKMIVHAASQNTQVSLGHVFKREDGAVVVPVATVYYFIGPASNGVAGNKALYRQENNDTAEEIADGVEKMQIEFGVVNNVAKKLPKDLDLRAQKFVSADQLSADYPVVAVRVNLLLKSQEANMVSKVQTYRFNGVTETAPDRRMYTPFSTTISMRNQVN